MQPSIIISVKAGNQRFSYSVGSLTKMRWDDFRVYDKTNHLLIRVHTQDGMPVISAYDNTDTLVDRSIIRQSGFSFGNLERLIGESKGDKQTPVTLSQTNR